MSKTINYKEKYEKALERARVYWENDNDNTLDIKAKGTMEHLFPELKKITDEEIRKWIINEIKIKHHNLDEDNVDFADKAIAWLEKQGKQEIKEKPIWKHWKDGIAGNGEGKQIYLIKSGDSYTLSSCLGYECDYIELSELDRLLEKQGEQKPAWSEEDEVRLQACIDILQAKSIMGKVNTIQTNWLKSLKQGIGG